MIPIQIQNQNMSSQVQARRHRAQTQAIYLVKADLNSTRIVFHILGSTKHVYTVTFKLDCMPACSCPDCKIHKNVCKHIYWILMKVLGLELNDWLETTDLEEIKSDILQKMPHLAQDIIANDAVRQKYQNYLDNKGKPTDDTPIPDDTKVMIRNSECAICLCDIPEDVTKSTIMLCHQCMNGIHIECWQKWASMNGSKKCIYCRSLVSSDYGRRKGVIIEDGWGVLID